ncbi:MAG: coproporphyrinogen III oxidase [Oligoflexia bacterium]|nr:MAG: coproporphyrinogen III oxidase [Oligoflexia bacterium]
MAFGVYVHIPYCIQRCLYCDFATFEQSQIAPPESYLKLVEEEILQRSGLFHPQTLDTLYFGGGTPSLVPAQIILTIMDSLANSGYATGPQSEVTIEINPATIDPEKLDLYLKRGINRFSVGAQTFNDPLLKKIGRLHNSQDTLETLNILKSRGLNYSFDLLFALPGQSLDDLRRDLEKVVEFSPPHISPYCLTIPEGHVLSPGRPLEDHQILMFEEISKTLRSAGYHQYEISNYALPGFESRHNSLYWADEEYWGIGLGAHSYRKKTGWGERFWNPNTFSSYEKSILRRQGARFDNLQAALNSDCYEVLEKHQSLTDFCHISLRRDAGLFLEQIRQKFGDSVAHKIVGPLNELAERGLLVSRGGAFTLSEEGKVLSNQVFSALTFLAGEV